jgi:hypothetical protein
MATTPSREEIEVATGTLRREARIWEEQAEKMAEIVPRIEALRLDRIEAGLFQVVFDTYGQAVDQIIARSREGRECMTDIGSTLRRVADTYDREEDANVHRTEHIY